MTALLELEDVHAYYGGALILDGVAFSVNPGEAVGLVGRNGAGKTTTLLSIFAVPRVRGTIRVDGTPLSGRRKYEAAARGVSLVPQGRRVFPNLTVMENLALGQASRRAGPWNPKRVLELFPNLERRRSAAGTALSGGEQQMLAIGRSLMSNPKVLLLDEPTEGLAPVVIDELMSVLRKIQETGTALLLVEQNVRVVSQVVQRFVAIRQGRIVSEGRVEELESRAVQELVAL